MGPSSSASPVRMPRLDRRSDRRTPSGGWASRSWNQAANASLNSRSRLPLRQHAEERVDRRFHRPLPKQVGAESMDRADVRLFEILHGGVEPLAASSRDGRAAARLFEMLPQSELQLPCRLLGERDRDDLPNVGAALRDYAHDAAHELGRLARTGGRLDDQRLVDRASSISCRACSSESDVWQNCEGV